MLMRAPIKVFIVLLYRCYNEFSAEFVLIKTKNMAAFAAGIAAGAAYIGCFFCCKGIQECMERQKTGEKSNLHSFITYI